MKVELETNHTPIYTDPRKARLHEEESWWGAKPMIVKELRFGVESAIWKACVVRKLM